VPPPSTRHDGGQLEAGRRRGPTGAAPGSAGVTPGVPDRQGALRITAVVFDLGGVLIDWDPTYVLDHDDVVALDIDGLQRELDLGRPIRQVRARWRAAHPGGSAMVDRYVDEWHHTMAGAFDEVVGILSELRDAPVGLYVLSNFSGVLFRQARHRFPFLDWFDGIVISGDEGVVKPDPEIYRRLVDRLALTAARTVFIDDRPDNVAGAQAAGLVGLHHRTAPGLRAQLHALGVLATPQRAGADYCSGRASA
jgi:2-haloacid dehalogenase